jgi:hypothetical protein
MNGDSEARAYTEDERDRWDLPNYGLPKTLPIKLDEVIIVVLHALRFALYLGLSGLQGLTEFIGLASDEDNTEFLQGLINDPCDFDEDDPIVCVLMPGNWESLRERLLAEAGPRNATAVLMNDPRPTEERFYPPPRGRPPAGCIWNTVIGTWEPDGTEAEVETTTKKRPRGPTPHGKVWDSQAESWADDTSATQAAAGGCSGGGGSEKKKKPRGPVPHGKKWNSVTGQWDSAPTAAVEESAMEEAVLEELTCADSTEDTAAPTQQCDSLGRSSGGKGKFRPLWRQSLKYLLCVKTTELTCCSPAGEACPGCKECSVMRCADCISRKKENVFGFASKGCGNFKKTAVADHVKCHHLHDAHGQASIEESVSKYIHDHEERIKSILMTVLWLAKNRLPMHKIKQMSALLRFRGVGLGRKYVNEKMARDMLLCLAFVVREMFVLEHARSSPLLGLMVDESMDVSKSENMVLYLRFMAFGIWVTRFWRIVKCHSATAVGLRGELVTAFNEDGLEIKKVGCFATDGASVMTGRIGGLAALLRVVVGGWLISIHCIAHREALAAKAAADGNQVCVHVEGALSDAVSYHTSSAKRTDKLAVIQKQLQVKLLRVVPFHKVRWLSRGLATATMWSNLACLSLVFRNDKPLCQTAGPLYDTFTSHYFICALAIFADLFEALNQLNKSFQKIHVVYADAMRNINAFLAMINALYLGAVFVGGARWKSLKERMGAGIGSATPPTPDGTFYRIPGTDILSESDDDSSDEGDDSADEAPQRTPDIPLVYVDEGEQSTVIDGIKLFVGALEENFALRFPTESTSIVEWLSGAFHFPSYEESYVVGGPADLIREAQVKKLIDYFGNDVQLTNGTTGKALINIADATAEWSLFKFVLIDFKKNDLDLDVAFKPIFESDDYPNMRILLCFFMCLCLSTVCCEAGFSLMANIMTKLRNCLNIITLDALMQIASNCPIFLQDDTNDEVMKIIVDRSYTRWTQFTARYPGRAHGKQGRKKKSEPMQLADLFDLQAKVPVGSILIEESDGEGGDEDDGTMEDDAEDEEEEEEEEFAVVGDFEPPAGWVVLAEPAEDSAAWSKAKKKYSWAGKRLAHIWDAPLGWQVASFSQITGKALSFYYPSDKLKCIHQLPLETYGTDGHWVIIEKEG